VGQRGRGGEPAARGPEARDLLLILREARDRGALPDDPVGVTHVRRDLLGCAFHLDEENGFASG
jgi:hypothetical protein